MDNLARTLQTFGPARLAAMAGVFMTVAAFFVYLVTKATEPDFNLLFSNLDPAEGGKIVTKLETMGVPYQLLGDGTQIFVPRDRVARLRMEMAESGLPAGGIVGYELFDRNDAYTLSGPILDINQTRALEGELAKSIRSLANVADARVHLVLPKKELFSRDRADATASVVMRMKSSVRLNSMQVQGVQHLVASAVPGLQPQRISIVDDKGFLLARGHGADDASGVGISEMNQSQFDMKTVAEQKMGQILDSILEKTLGANKVRTQVSLEMSFDRVTIDSEEYNPEGQVARQIQSSNDNSISSEASGGGGVSVQNQLPEGGTAGGAGAGGSSNMKKSDESTTFEISKTVKHQIKEMGEIKRQSVAVLVDNPSTKSADGKVTEGKFTPEQIEKIKTLVKTSIGFKEDRGDVVEVVNMPFAPVDEVGPAAEESFLKRFDLMAIAQRMMLAFIGLIVMLTVVKPFLLRLAQQSASLADAEMISAGALMAPQVAAASSGTLPAPASSQAMTIEPITVNKDPSIKRLASVVDANPEETVAIVRDWMSNDGTRG